MPDHPDALAAAAIADLRARGVVVDDGLDDLEISSLEASLDLTFPRDLVALLTAGVPVGDGWPDWRGPLGPLEEHVRRLLAAPDTLLSAEDLWTHLSSGGPASGRG